MATKKSSQFLQNLKDVVNQTVATQKSVATNARINFAKQATTPQPYTKTTSTNPVIKGATNVKNALNYLGNAGQYLGNTLYGVGKQAGKQMVVQPAVKVVRNIAVNPNVVKAGTQNSAKLRGAVLGAVPKAIYQETIKPAAQQTLGLATKALLSALTAPKQIKTSVANLNPNNKIPEYLQARPQTTYNVPKALQGLVGGKKIETLQKGYQTAGEQTGQIWKQNIPAYEKVVGTAATFTKPVLETVGGFGLIKGGLNATAESLSREFGDNPDRIAAWQRMGYPRSAKELKTNFGQAAYNLHPDRPTGNIAEFEKLNSDYQLLQKTGLPNAATQSGILTKIGEMSSRAINPISQLGAINPQQAGYLAENAPMLTQNAGQPVSFPSETSVNIPISQQYLRPAIGLSVKEVGNQPDSNKVGKEIIPQTSEITGNEITPIENLPYRLQVILGNIQEKNGSKELFLSQWKNLNSNTDLESKNLLKSVKSDLKTIGLTPEKFYDTYTGGKLTVSPKQIETPFVPTDTGKFNNLTDYLSVVLRTPKLDFSLQPLEIKNNILDAYIENWYKTKGIPFNVSAVADTKKKILTDVYNGSGLPNLSQPTLEADALRYNNPKDMVSPTASPTIIPKTESIVSASQPVILNNQPSVLATTQPQVTPTSQNINTASFNVSDEAKSIINDDAGGLLKNKPITNEEVITSAKSLSDNFRDISRNQTVLLAARQLKMRQIIGELAEKIKSGVASGEDAQNLIKLLKIEKDHASSFGVDLNSQKILANPEDAGAINNILSAVVRSVNDIQPVLDAAAKMTPADWQNGAKVQAFYRQFIKPTVGEVLTEYRMANMLGGPRTGIRNFSVNIFQGGVLRPAVKLVAGGVDQIGSALSGSQQTHYIQEVAPYYKGFINSLPQAFNKFVEVMKSGMYNVQDVKEIPTGKIPAFYTTLSRALGAADALSHEMIYSGEKEALLTRAKLQGKELTPSTLASIDKQAHDTAAKYLFHGKTDITNATGQGNLMAAIDKLTSVAYSIRRVPGGNILVPFIKTSAEVMKQGIELTPAGMLNIPGSADKVESVSKSLIGSAVLLGAAFLAAKGLLTGDKPKDKKSAELWAAAHKSPWSLKVGDKWISYDNLGPLGMPLAIAAIFKDALGDNPNDKMLDNAKQISTALVSFIGSQTWIGNLSDISDVISGKDYAITQLAASSVGQFIPQEALLRSLAGITDAIKRSPKTFIEKLKANIPILEKTLPAATDINGQPLVKQFNFFNSVSPFTVYKEDPNYIKKLNDYNAIQTFNAGRKSMATDIKTELAQKIQNGTATIGDVNNAVRAGVIPDDKASVEEFIAENKFVKERANLSAKIASGNATVGDLNNAVKSGWIYDSKSAVETFVMSAKDPVIGYFANLPTASQLAYMQKLKEIGDTATINKLAPYVNKDWWKYNKK